MLTIALVARGEEDSDAASASAPVKAFTTRSVPSTVSSILALICSKSVRANGFIEGSAKALFTTTSTRPYSASVAATNWSTASSSVISVGTTSERPPAASTSAEISLSRDSVRAASTTRAPCAAARRQIARPSPGPTPDTTTTLSSRSPTPAMSVTPAFSLQNRAGGGRFAQPIPRGRACCRRGRADDRRCRPRRRPVPSALVPAGSAHLFAANGIA